MRMTSTRFVAGWPSAGRRRRRAGPLKPTLQGPLAGATVVALFLEYNANQTATPSWVLLSHVYHLLEGRVVGWHLLGCTAIIVRHDPLLTAIGKAAHQMTHRARRQLQRFGEGGHRLSLLPTGQNCLPNRDRNRSRHEIILRDVGQDQSTAPMIIRTAVAAKPNVGINGKRLCRVTEYLTRGLASNPHIWWSLRTVLMVAELIRSKKIEIHQTAPAAAPL